MGEEQLVHLVRQIEEINIAIKHAKQINSPEDKIIALQKELAELEVKLDTCYKLFCEEADLVIEAVTLSENFTINKG